MLADQFVIELNQLVPVESFDEAANIVAQEQSGENSGRMRRAFAALGGSKLAAAMAEKFREIDLLPLFAKGWGESDELEKESDTAPANGQPKFVRLGKFEQNLDLYPILSVSVLGFTAEPVKLTLTLQAEFEAVEVGLKRGYIVEVGGGFCRLSALLKYGQFSFPAGVAPVDIQLNNTRRFSDPGIAITGRKSSE